MDRHPVTKFGFAASKSDKAEFAPIPGPNFDSKNWRQVRDPIRGTVRWRMSCKINAIVAAGFRLAANGIALMPVFPGWPSTRRDCY